MYHFPNLDDKTCSIMISELERDIKNGLFYEPSSMKPEYIASYKLLLRKYFEIGHVEGLEKALTSSFFKVKDKNGRKVSSNIAKMIAFSDFNRYYVRAILVKAIEENKSVCIYRAKQGSTLKYLENVKEHFNKYCRIYLYLDTDDTGIAQMEKTKTKFSFVEIKTMSCGCKDFNEHYLKCIKGRN